MLTGTPIVVTVTVHANAFNEMAYDINLIQADYPDILSILLAGLQSDHLMIMFTIGHHLNKVIKPSNYRFNYIHANWRDMHQYIYEHDFSPIFCSHDTEFIWKYLKTAIHKAEELHIPKLSIKRANQPKWSTSSIRHKLNYLCTAKRSYARHSTETNKQKICNLGDELQQMIASTKANYESELVFTFTHTHSCKIKGQDNYPILMFYTAESN